MHKAATHVRASPDYVPVRNLPLVQWAIGPDVVFHWAGLGLLPYKDTFFSDSSETPRSTTAPFSNYRESSSMLHALMATLSGGPVTYSDAVGAANLTLLRAIVREDGVVLRPSFPVTALDIQMQAMAFGNFPGKLPAGEVALDLMTCDVGQSAQHWAALPAANVSGGFVLASALNKCIDIAACNRSVGGRVDAFDCVYGEPVPVGTCDGKPRGALCIRRGVVLALAIPSLFPLLFLFIFLLLFCLDTQTNANRFCPVLTQVAIKFLRCKTLARLTFCLQVLCRAFV